MYFRQCDVTCVNYPSSSPKCQEVAYYLSNIAYFLGRHRQGKFFPTKLKRESVNSTSAVVLNEADQQPVCPATGLTSDDLKNVDLLHSRKACELKWNLASGIYYLAGGWCGRPLYEYLNDALSITAIGDYGCMQGKKSNNVYRIWRVK